MRPPWRTTAYAHLGSIASLPLAKVTIPHIAQYVPCSSSKIGARDLFDCSLYKKEGKYLGRNQEICSFIFESHITRNTVEVNAKKPRLTVTEPSG
jgi:hypothetical protein